MSVDVVAKTFYDLINSGIFENAFREINNSNELIIGQYYLLKEMLRALKNG